MKSLLIAGGVLLALAVPSAAAAAADGSTALSAQTRALCAARKVACSVQAPATWVAGERQDVAVTGRAGVTVKVRAFRLVTRGGRERLVPLSEPVRLRTGASGFAQASLQIPASVSPGGQVVVALADSAGRDLESVLGTWTEVVSTTPVVLGDGYGRSKPVGVDLQLRLASVVPDTSYEVQIEVDGTWRPAGRASAGSTVQHCSETSCVIDYRLPRGLSPRPHDIRSVEQASSTPDARWRAIPDAQPAPKDYRSVPLSAPLGSAVLHSVNAGTAGQMAAVAKPRSADLKVPEQPGPGVPGALQATHPDDRVVAVFAAGGMVFLLGALLGLRGSR